MVRTGPQNPLLQGLIQELKKKANEHDSNLWRRLAFDLERPTRERRVVNLYRINRYAEANETVVIPGKVLAVGELDHPVTVAAFTFSGSAQEKINKLGKAISINKLLQENPKGKKIRILG
jgi:large subunit ribosomal protein L18e